MNVILDLTTPMFCILLCIGCGIGWLLWKKHNYKIRYWVIPLFVCYLLMLIKLTMFPIFLFDQETLAEIREGAGKYFVFYQIVPFASIKKYFFGGALIQFIGNILLLSPLAVFAEIFVCQRPKAWKVVASLSAISLLIEIVQLASNVITGHPSRIADIDDLILNIAGILITILLTRCLGKNQKIRTNLQKVLYR